MTALYHADVPLGLGLTATITIVEHDPAPPPPSGTEWAHETDWPIAELRIDLPSRSKDYHLADELRCDLRVLGEALCESWGDCRRNNQYQPIAGPHHKTTTERAEYLDDAVASLRSRAESELAPLIAHVAKRAARLAAREATLARGRAGRPKQEPEERPLELDTEPRATATAPIDDDSSQRFALLEIDAPQPARAKRAKKAA